MWKTIVVAIIMMIITNGNSNYIDGSINTDRLIKYQVIEDVSKDSITVDGLRNGFELKHRSQTFMMGNNVKYYYDGKQIDKKLVVGNVIINLKLRNNKVIEIHLVKPWELRK